jgi:hypothetical protein
MAVSTVNSVKELAKRGSAFLKKQSESPRRPTKKIDEARAQPMVAGAAGRERPFLE